MMAPANRTRWTVGTRGAALAGALAVAVLAGVVTSRIAAPGEDRPASRVPSVAPAAQPPAALARLDRARVNGRTALRRAETPVAQARVARRLADRHLTAADALRPSVRADWASVADDLERSGRAYAALARAAGDGSARRFDAARGKVRIAEAGLASTIDHALEAGTQPSAPPRSVPQAGGNSGWAGDLLLLVLVLLASGAAGFVSSGPVVSGAGRVARAARHRARPSADWS
jgi:hypothetical protein